MKKNEEITKLAEEIMEDITNDRLPLHNVLLKASRLSLLLEMPDNVTWFNNAGKYAEENQFIKGAFESSIAAARDVPISNANPHSLFAPIGNSFERSGIRTEAKQVVGFLANYRTQTYNFALNTYQKWQFGNIAESIFEKKRNKVEPILIEIFPDANQRLNSIEQNINSTNSEDWKNAVASCRTLLTDIADILNPAKISTDKGKYLNRLKDFVSPMILSETKNKLIKSYFDELKNRIEYTSNLTQGGAHKDRPIQEEAEDIVLYTYLLIAELLKIYKEKIELENHKL